MGHSDADPVEAHRPSAAGGIPLAGAETPSEPGKSPRLRYVTLPGCWGALIAGCLSFTPSLLPRGGLIQGVIWGITAAIGYGVAVLGAWIWRAFADRAARRPRRRSWPAFFVAAAVLATVSFGLGQYWQYQIRKLTDVTEYNVWLVVAAPFVAALVFCLIMLTGRGVRGVYRRVAQLDAVFGAWSQLPQQQRPRLFVAGESLGSFGGESAFSGEYSLHNLTAGALFAGPPNFNTLFREFTDHRDPGSPEIQPVYQDGRIVRFANDPDAGVPPQGQQWADSGRVLYLMHPSDPIVWWSPSLIFRAPDWISETRGTDVLQGMFWIPFVSFWQVTADLPFATGVPAGHGHTYTSEYVDGWNAVLRPSGFTPANLAELRTIIAAGG